MIIPILSMVLLPLAFLCKQDKKVFWLLWSFMTIIIVMNNYNNVDWNAYEFMYNIMHSVKDSMLTDAGYGFLNFIAKEYGGLNFFQFRAIFTLVGMFVLARIIVKSASYPALVLALYYIAPFFPNDIIQIRNFMAQVLLSYFWVKWLNTENKNICWLILSIALATTMHASSLYFVVFVLLHFVHDERKLYLGVGIGSFFVGILPTLMSKIPFISIEKISFYLGSKMQSIDVRGLIIIVMFLIQLYILYRIRDFAYETQNSKLIKWTDMIYKMNILCLPACVIMTVWSFNFYRVPRNMLLLNYIVYSMYLVEKGEKRILHFLTFVLIGLGICWSALNSFSQWSVIWNNNALIKW